MCFCFELTELSLKVANCCDRLIPFLCRLFVCLFVFVLSRAVSILSVVYNLPNTVFQFWLSSGVTSSVDNSTLSVPVSNVRSVHWFHIYKRIYVSTGFVILQFAYSNARRMNCTVSSSSVCICFAKFQVLLLVGLTIIPSVADFCKINCK